MTENSDKGKAEPPKENTEYAKKVSFFGLFRYSNASQKLLIFVATLASIASNACGPLNSIILGSSVDLFRPDNSSSLVLDKVATRSFWLLIVALASFFLSSLAESCWITLGERLGIRVRTMCLESVLRKDVGWYDSSKPQELPMKVSMLVSQYQGGIGDKMNKVLGALALLAISLGVAFAYGWHLALALLAVAPIMIFVGKFTAIVTFRGADSSKRAYEKCAGYAEEALAAVKTVCAFCAQGFEAKRYLGELDNAQSVFLKNSTYLSAAVGLLSTAISLTHGLGYFVGSFFVQHHVHDYIYDEDYSVGTITTVFHSVMLALLAYNLVTPHLSTVGTAQTAAYDIYSLIESGATNPHSGTSQISPELFKGRIEFCNVSFAYPTKPDAPVLKDFSAVFEAGKMTGICGETGSGKSTIVQLIERFYEPTAGQVKVDGVDISTLDLGWWRQKIGYVCQEPMLFNTSIRKNIEYGKPGASMEEVRAAAEQANAGEFIDKLEAGYEAVAGSDGGQLSGGQKQRIAIARALIKSPKIVLLDEATSALDTNNERTVQDAIWKLQKEQGLTMVVIAHRLSTIKGADKIVVLDRGTIKEEGTDAELRARNSVYAAHCKFQEGDPVETRDVELTEIGQPKTSPKERVQDKNVEGDHVKGEDGERKQLLVSKYKSQFWSENWKHACPFAGAISLAFIAGSHSPILGFLYATIFMDVLEPDLDEMRRKVNLDFIAYVIVGVVIFFVVFGMTKLFGYVAVTVTYNLRSKLYSRYLSMDPGWFDESSNQPTALNQILSQGTEEINSVVRMIAKTVFELTSAMLVALGIGFGFSWRIALIMLGCLLLMCLNGFVQVKHQAKYSKMKEELYTDSGKILSEAIKNFRTVLSFSAESRVIRSYKDSLGESLKKSQAEAVVTGMLFGVGQAMQFFVNSGLFYFTALFMDKYGEPAKDSFIAMYTSLLTAMLVVFSLQYAPDMGRAYASLYTIYDIFDQEPKIVSPPTPSEQQITGRIEFKDVSFKYPSRKDPVLDHLSMTIEPGQRVAIVGASGSGKSTIIQLLERFYDADSGQILLDGVDIKQYDITKLRQSLGYVPQEPTLFDLTIEDNVRYGRESASREEVAEACRVAGAMDFITSSNRKEVERDDKTPLETEKGLNSEANDGFGQKVGARGALISGGQKQRLAIARAVLKQPKIMLFDEATSALDSKTEGIVQRALNQVAAGRTSLVVAHRLSTIEDGDTIFVGAMQTS